MYHYVEDKEFLKQAQNWCANCLKNLELELRKQGINSQFFLVGSGARNMVMQNEKESIDFDYNINVISCEDSLNERAIKESVRKALNKVLDNYGLKNVEDSTSSLTLKPMYFKGTDTAFSIDICIVKKDEKGNWQRLIHDKKGNVHNYYWNTAPNSKNYSSKAKRIKEVPGAWEVVRGEYQDIKNNYLTHNDYNHPSFVCYIEAVNNVYNSLIQKKIL